MSNSIKISYTGIEKKLHQKDTYSRIVTATDMSHYIQYVQITPKYRLTVHIKLNSLHCDYPHI